MYCRGGARPVPSRRGPIHRHPALPSPEAIRYARRRRQRTCWRHVNGARSTLGRAPVSHGAPYGQPQRWNHAHKGHNAVQAGCTAHLDGNRRLDHRRRGHTTGGGGGPLSMIGGRRGRRVANPKLDLARRTLLQGEPARTARAKSVIRTRARNRPARRVMASGARQTLREPAVGGV